VWGVAEVFRLTGDRAFLRELWPYARKAAAAITVLRAQRTGDAWRGTACFGLLPESISHEGYAASPVHAYWDDFFAVRALADATELARVLGDAESTARFAGERDAMRADLVASIAATMKQHGIDYLPGSVELGDFDPTSTAIAFDPAARRGGCARAALERSFERYWQEFEARRRGEAAAYTPYEIRNATALLRLGWKARALELLGWLVEEQRPPAWRQWPEVSTRDPREPRFRRSAARLGCLELRARVAPADRPRARRGPGARRRGGRARGVARRAGRASARAPDLVGAPRSRPGG
jgi:hypothetical protein